MILKTQSWVNRNSRLNKLWTLEGNKFIAIKLASPPLWLTVETILNLVLRFTSFTNRPFVKNALFQPYTAKCTVRPLFFIRNVVIRRKSWEISTGGPIWLVTIRNSLSGSAHIFCLPLQPSILNWRVYKLGEKKFAIFSSMNLDLTTFYTKLEVKQSKLEKVQRQWKIPVTVTLFASVRPSCIKEEKLIRVIKLDKYAITLFASGKTYPRQAIVTPAKF